MVRTDTQKKCAQFYRRIFSLAFWLYFFIDDQLILTDNQRTTYPKLFKQTPLLEVYFVFLVNSSKTPQFWKNYNCPIALLFDDWGKLNSEWYFYLKKKLS